MYVKKKSHKFFRFFGGVHAIASFKVTDWQLMYQTCFPVLWMYALALVCPKLVSQCCGCANLHLSVPKSYFDELS